jgi:hypothetical protein
MAGKFSLKMPDFHVAFRDLLHAVNLRHGTHSFTSLPKGRRAKDSLALKIPKASTGFEPANLGNKDQHATSRPSKPLISHLKFVRASTENGPSSGEKTKVKPHVTKLATFTRS